MKLLLLKAGKLTVYSGTSSPRCASCVVSTHVLKPLLLFVRLAAGAEAHAEKLSMCCQGNAHPTQGDHTLRICTDLHRNLNKATP